MKIRIGLKTSPGGKHFSIKGGSYNTNDWLLALKIAKYCQKLTNHHNISCALDYCASQAFIDRLAAESEHPWQSNKSGAV